MRITGVRHARQGLCARCASPSGRYRRHVAIEGSRVVMIRATLINRVAPLVSPMLLRSLFETHGASTMMLNFTRRLLEMHLAAMDIQAPCFQETIKMPTLPADFRRRASCIAYADAGCFMSVLHVPIGSAKLAMYKPLSFGFNTSLSAVSGSLGKSAGSTVLPTS